MTPDLYVYKAHLVNIVDGDTVDVDINLGFNMIMADQRLRLYGINTPEMRGPEREQGIIAKDFVELVFAENGYDCFIKSYKDRSGKYGRWLADIIWAADGGSISLCDLLRAKGWGIED